MRLFVSASAPRHLRAKWIRVRLSVFPENTEMLYHSFHHFFCGSGGEPSSVVTGTPAAGSR